MIIVEGMDNSGKSTLIANISNRFGLKVIKRSGPPQADVTINITLREATQAFMLDTLSFLELNPQVIFDRFPLLSEEVYGPILRDGSVFQKGTLPAACWLERLRQCNPLIVYCRPPEEKILCFSPRRAQMDGVIDNARELINRYDHLIEGLEKRGFMVVRHDFTALVNWVPVETAVSQYLKVAGGNR